MLIWLEPSGKMGYGGNACLITASVPLTWFGRHLGNSPLIN
jgi:hypothetical protein